MTTADRPAEEPRRFTRSRDGRIVAGVCQGAGEYFDVDPVIFRVTLAVLAVFGGAGIVIYGLAWLLIPEAGSPSTRLERALEGHGGRRREALVVAATVIVVMILAYGNPLTHRVRGAFVAIVLILAVTALVGRRRTERRQRWAPPEAPAAVPRFGPVNQSTADQPTAVSSQPAAPRSRSWLGWLTFAGTLLVGGTLGVIALSGAAHPQPADVLAACVAVVGVGMLVGTFFGRALVMIPLGLLLVGSLAVANALPRDLTWTAGSRTWTPVSAQPQPYVLGAGDATLDLTQLAPHSTTAVVSRVGAGRLVVLVPAGAAVDIHAHTSAGRIEFFGREEDGTGVSLDDTHAGSALTARSVTLDLTMGFGDVEVRNAAA